jgi:DNA-binding transcriptional regulator YdaS (Cro superfamily)
MEKLNEFFKANRGMQIRLARHLGLQPSTVSQWRSVPVEHLAEVADFTGIAREELLPDAFREPRQSAEDAA